jgi:hypothetical protein
MRLNRRDTDPRVQMFSLLLQAAPPSAGGCAAASAGVGARRARGRPGPVMGSDEIRTSSGFSPI